jgi:multimeric flavodoxin WrbA
MMKIIGFSAGVVGRDSNVDRIVKEIMDETGYDTDFVKLTDVDYSACKGCVWLCAGPEVCRLEDDLLPYYQKVKEADAVVLGSPVHFGTKSATMTAFISRLWGFRHVNFAIKKKPFVLALSGIFGEDKQGASDDFRKALRPFLVNVVDVVHYHSGIPPCYSCGRHQECRIGGAYHLWGDEVRSLTIAPEHFRKWEDCPATVAQVGEAAEKLRQAVLRVLSLNGQRRPPGAEVKHSTYARLLRDHKR